MSAKHLTLNEVLVGELDLAVFFDENTLNSIETRHGPQSTLDETCKKLSQNLVTGGSETIYHLHMRK